MKIGGVHILVALTWMIGFTFWLGSVAGVYFNFIDAQPDSTLSDQFVVVGLMAVMLFTLFGTLAAVVSATIRANIAEKVM